MEDHSPEDTGLPEGWRPRSKPVESPGGVMFRVKGPRGEVGIAIQFREDLIDHPMLQRGMDDVADFVLAPEVPGVLPLVAWNRERALFIYKIDDGQLLSEVLGRCFEQGVVPGERVAIELLGRAALALDDAARAGARVGVDNHGCLTPWRIVVYPGGEVALLGYALPPIEVFAWLDEETDEPPGHGLRYTPPERIQDSMEDLRTDVYTLGMIAAEVALGAPLLRGTPQRLVDQILEGEPAAALGEFSEATRGLLEVVLHPAKAARPSTGSEVANLAKRVLPNLRGHSLGGLARGAFHEDAVLLEKGMSYPALLYVESSEIEVVDYDEEDTDEVERPAQPSATIVPEAEPTPDPAPPEPTLALERPAPPEHAEAPEQPALEPQPEPTLALEQPAPEQPAPEQPAPEQPAPEQPAPEQPAPEPTLALEQPALEQPEPQPEPTLALEQLAPEQPAPEPEPEPEQPPATEPPGALEQPAPEPGPSGHDEPEHDESYQITIDVPEEDEPEGEHDIDYGEFDDDDDGAYTILAASPVAMFPELERRAPQPQPEDPAETADTLIAAPPTPNKPSPPEPPPGALSLFEPVEEPLPEAPPEEAPPEEAPPEEAPPEEPEPEESLQAAPQPGEPQPAEPELVEPPTPQPGEPQPEERPEPPKATEPQPRGRGDVSAQAQPEERPSALLDFLVSVLEKERTAPPEAPPAQEPPRSERQPPQQESPQPEPRSEGQPPQQESPQPEPRSEGQPPQQESPQPEHQEPPRQEQPGQEQPRQGHQEQPGQGQQDPDQIDVPGSVEARLEVLPEVAPWDDSSNAVADVEDKSSSKDDRTLRLHPRAKDVPPQQVRLSGNLLGRSAKDNKPNNNASAPPPVPPQAVDPDEIDVDVESIGHVVRGISTRHVPSPEDEEPEAWDDLPQVQPKATVVQRELPLQPRPAAGPEEDGEEEPQWDEQAQEEQEELPLQPRERSSVLHLKAVTVDLEEGLVLRGEELTRLSSNQTAVLSFFAHNARRSLDREQIWREALGEQGSPDSVRGIVTRLRKKIEDDPAEPDHLLNVYGVGYRFEPGEAPEIRPEPLPRLDAALRGRDSELEVVQDALEEAPLVSVVGPPGSGANQLALQTAHALQAEGWEVHHCAVDGPEPMFSRLARGLGIRRIGRKESEILTDIGTLLSQRDDLLLFLEAPDPDPDLRETLESWSSRAPEEGGGRVLVACRGAFKLPRERSIRLVSLDEEDAVALFRERVAQFRPGIQIDDALATSIINHLDRMPVAIEAAAAQTAFLSPELLLERLERGQDLEWGEAGLDADLSATIDRLDRVERAVLEQCIVFRGGFDLRSAESVIQMPVRDRGMITVIESLCARSLLKVTSGGDSANVRWSAYETARSYLRRTLSPYALDDAQQRHGVCFGTLGLDLGARPWVERPERAVLLRERDNLRGALQQGGPSAAGAALGLTAILGQEQAGPLCEAVDRILEDPTLKDLPEDSPPWRAAALLASARLNLYLGQPQKARDALKASAEQIPIGSVALLVNAAWLHMELGSTFEAEAALHRISTTEPWVLATAALLRGRALVAKGDGTRGERAFVESLHGFGTLEADIGSAHSQRHLAEVLATRGQGRRAVALLAEAMEVFLGAGDQLHACQCQMRMAQLLVGIGAAEEATEHLEAVMESAKEASAHGLIALARGILGVVHTIEHNFDEAERMFFLALAGSAPEHNRIQSLFALNLMLRGDHDTAHEEAIGALPDPVARALVATLERQPAPHDHPEAFMLFEVLEAWRAAASTTRLEAKIEGHTSVAVRMVLACPRSRPGARSGLE